MASPKQEPLRLQNETALRQLIAQVLDVPADEIDLDQPPAVLGLDSLAAAELQERLLRDMNIAAELGQILGCERIGALLIRDDAAGGPAPLRLADPPVAALGSTQEALCLVAGKEPESSAYHLCVAFRWPVEADEPTIRRAVTALQERHTELTAVLGLNARGQPVKTYTPAGRRDSVVVHAAQAGSALPMDSRLQQAVDAPIDLAAGPLFRVEWYGEPCGGSTCLLVAHHAIMDLWSFCVVLDDFVALLGGEPDTSGSRRAATYADFVAAQAACMREGRERHLAFWRPRFQPPPPRLVFEGEPAAAAAGSAARRHGFVFPPGLTAALVQRARALAVTPNSLLLALYALALARFAGQQTLLVGVPVAGRRSAAFARTVGCFINTLGLPLRIGAAADLTELIVGIHQEIRAAQAHDDWPFHQLMRDLDDGTETSRRADLQAAFVLQRIPKLSGAEALVLGLAGETCVIRGHTVDALPVAAGATPFDLGLMMIDCAGRLHGRFEFRPAAVSAALVAGLAEYFTWLAECVVTNPRQRLDLLDGLVPSQRESWREHCFGAVASFPGAAGIFARFAAVAEQQRDRGALVAGTRQYSYAAVAAQATALGARLRAAGVRAEQRVALMTERQADTVIGMLAIWSAGAVYVPVAEDAPPERIERILEDCQPARILATAQAWVRVPSAWREKVENLDAAATPVAAAVADVEVAVAASQLAYIVYTSGSEGLPKGVMVTHGGAVNFALSQAALLGLDANERILQQASFGFDASLSDVLMALLTGACLYIASPAQRLPGTDFDRFVEDNRVSLITVSASLLEAIERPQFSALRTVISTAEACSESIVRRWGQRHALFNGYGPTEVTIGATIGRCAVAAPGGRPSIGRPFHNYSVYVLDDALRPAPYGVAGDLYIGGSGVARGYLHDPRKSAQAFLPDPFASQPGQRMYRTGDRGLLRSDGTFECLGRRDQQIKIRGHRVELAEVERAVRALAGVRLAAVVAFVAASGKSELHAFLEPGADGPADVAAWRAQLKSRLPDYMRPTRLHAGPVPLTANGKIDRKALLARLAQLPAAPMPDGGDGVEHRLRAIWQRTLGHAEFSRDDNFFDIGGHSLALATVQAGITAEFGEELSLTDLFRFHTLAMLARRLSAGGTAESAAPLRRAALAAGAPIAIVGMACRLPGADHCGTFWDNLVAGRCGVRFFSADELRAAGVPAALAAASDYVPARAPLDDPYAFDAALFGCAEREAELLDPQRRLLLECSFEALQQAGYDEGPRRAATAIGTYLSASENSYFAHYIRGNAELARIHGDLRLALAGDKSFVATYVAYKLRLKGPAMTVDTACSSSLVAVHAACNAIRSGDCEVALAGGMSVDCPQPGGHRYEMSGIGSRDGYCRAFDAEASGTVKGMGGAVVVLKDLAAARRDGDVVQAVILGSAVNNDAGRSAGYSAPSVLGQSEVIRAALQAAGVAATQIDLIEAHGTGTPLGDPIEFAALREVFTAAQVGRIPVGSVKSNIGHLDAAAGIAGLVKASLALQHRHCPPSLHLRVPNPELGLGEGPLTLACEAEPLPQRARPLHAGVSSFGIGGTNCHVVLAADVPPVPAAAQERAQLMLLSAHSAPALRQCCLQLADHVTAAADRADLAAIAYSLGVTRTPRAFRVGVVARSADELVTRLRSAAHRASVALPPVAARRVVFVLAGRTAAAAGLATCLYAAEAAYRQALDQALALFEATIAAAARDWLLRADAAPPPSPEYRQAAAFCHQLALCRYLQSFGLEPAAVLGCGSGHWVAAVVVGAVLADEAAACLQRQVSLPGADSGDVLHDDRLARCAGAAAASRTALTWLSRSSGAPVSAAELADPAGWKLPIHAPLPSEQALARLRAMPHSVVLVLGDESGALSQRLHEYPGSGGQAVVDIAMAADDVASHLAAAATLWECGVDLDAPGYFRANQDVHQRVALPPYGLERRRYCCTPPTGATTQAADTGAAAPPTDNGDTAVAPWLRRTWNELLGETGADAGGDFFADGGDSIAALRLCRLLEDRYGIRMDPAQLLAAAPFAAMVDVIEQALSSATAPAAMPPPPQAATVYALEPDGLPLSFQQRRMWFQHFMEAQPAILNLPLSLRWTAGVDVARLTRAFAALLRRHAVLCTRLWRSDDGPRQSFDRDPGAFAICVERATPGDLAGLVRQRAAAVFDLERDWLLRAHLFQTDGGDSVLLVVCHHILCDGHSLAMLLRDLLAYDDANAGAGDRVSLAPLQRYIQQQADAAAQAGFDAELGYWQRQLQGIAATPLPGAVAAPHAGDSRGECLTVEFAPDLAAPLRAFCAQHAVTPFVVVLAAFKCLIAQRTAAEDISIGTPAAERDEAGLAASVGLLVNTVVLRSRIRAEQTFAEVCRDLVVTVNGALANRRVPFDLVVERVSPAQAGRGRAPLFRAAFVMEDAAALLPAGAAGVVVAPVDTGHAQFELAVWLRFHGTQPSARLEFRRACFDPDAMVQFAREFGSLLSCVVADADIRVGDIGQVLMTAGEGGSLLFGAPAELPRSAASLAHQLLAAAERHAHRPAVLTGDTSITHSQLAARATRLAQRLQDGGVAAGERVAIYLPRSADLLLAMYGVLLSGAVAVPLETELPPARLQHMLADSAACLLLSRSDIALPFAAASLARLDIDIDAADAEPRAWRVTAQLDWPAYIIYTSGSSGTPKGVINTQRGLANRLLWMNRRYGFGSGDRFLHKTPISFDVALWELFCPLLCGASLVIAPPGDHRDPQALRRLIERYRISVAHFVPTMLQEYLAATAAHAGPAHVFCSGEGLPALTLAKARAHFGAATRLTNLYGPTEASIEVSDWEYRDRCDSVTAPIGRPISGASLYVLDASMRPVPRGEIGDLYIAGTCVALGYWGRAALTAASFLPDPWASEPGARLYRSGDLARVGTDGAVEFLGRRDAQLKIHGLRIEPGEIEAVLQSIAGIEAAVVMPYATAAGESRLVAYVVCANDPQRGEDLRRHLLQHLPAAMVPAAFVALQRLPVGANGKLDRAALPPPASPDGQGGAAPQGEIERLLAEIWCEVLELDQAGRDSDFFAAGGSSIRAIRLAARIEAASGRECAIRTIFAYPRLADLAAVLENAASAAAGGATAALQPAPDQADQPFEMTELQGAYWAGRSRAFELGNVATHGYLELDLRDLDVAALRSSVRHLVAKHDALRLVMDDQGRQRVLAQAPPFDIAYADLGELSADERQLRLAEIRDSLEHALHEPTRWPLFDFRLARLDQDWCRLFISIDALIVDGLSIQLLENELNAVYAEFRRGLPVQLPAVQPGSLRLRDYVGALNAQRSSAAYARARDYWTARVATLPPAPALPLVQDPATLEHPRFVRLSQRIGARASRRLARLAAEHRASLSVLLLAAYAEVLASWSNATALSLNLTISERVRLHPAVDRLVGNLSSVLIVGLDLPAGLRFGERLSGVRDALLEAIQQRSYSGIDVLRRLAAQGRDRDTARMPVVFTSLVDLEPPAAAAPRYFDFSRSAYALTQTSQVWLDCNVAWSGDELVVAWDAVASLFAPGTLDYFHREYVALLRRLADDPGAWQAQPVPLYADREPLRWQSAAVAAQALGSGELLHERFLDQAARHPERIAVATPRHCIAYGALANAARRLAQRLQAAGAQPNRPVAVILHNGWEQVLACLAVLIAGAPYLPIGASLPEGRRQRLLALGGCELVLTGEGISVAADAAPRTVIRVDESLFDDAAAEPFPAGGSSTDLAYVMFTSGSTGEPKGVMIDHRGAVNTVLDINRRFAVGADDAVLALSDFTFDLSVYDLFGLLSAGGKVVLPEPEQARDPGAWAELMHQQKVTLWNAVPALTQMLVDYLDGGPAAPPGLRLFLVSGDWIPVTLPGRLQRYFPDARFISLGGATEASIWSIAHEVGQLDADRASIPYGIALTAQSVLVVDPSLRLCPPGASGQIVIGGVGLAQGYWNSPAQTAKAFIVDAPTRQRLYLTGDLGRYGSGDVIEFLGRSDDQVKIRGHRIELGEIEQQLVLLDGIDRAVVRRHQSAAQAASLIAYVVLGETTNGMSARRAVNTLSAAAGDAGDSLRAALDAEARRPRFGVEMSRAELAERIAEFNRQYQQALFHLFFQLGLFGQAGEQASVDDVLLKGGIAARYRRWIARALAHLAEHGFLEADGEGWRCRRALPAWPAAPDLGYDLPAILSETQSSAELYLSESTIAGYQKIFSSCHSLVCAAVETLVAAQADGALNVLEVGAGHGSCTQHVLPLLPAQSRYRFSDISPYFLQAARDRFGAYPFVDYALYDLDLDPQFQGLQRHSFDLIVAASVLHDIRDLRAALEALYALLKPGATLILIEETRFFPFFDLGMGLQQGFDVFTDTALRRDHPLLSRQQWSQLLGECGFRASTWANPAGSAAELIGFDVLVARMPDSVTVLDEAGVEQALRAQLPDYMIPARYVCLPRMPLTANRKVDRKALPLPPEGADAQRADFVAPQGEMEQALAAIWSRVIGREGVGATDNFFRLGGDSLLAVQLAMQIQAQFDCTLPVRTIFEAPTIRELACLLELNVGADGAADAAGVDYARGIV